MNRHDELEAFKREINLSEYAAAALGFVLDRRESSRNSAVMRHPSGQKIVITRDSDSHWVYFTIGQDRDSGSIIDLIQNRRNCTLGDVRKELRPWIGEGPLPYRPPAPDTFARELFPVNRDRQGVISAWNRAADTESHPYLLARGIAEEIQSCRRFLGRIRIDQRRNAVFPHFDEEGLCGFELKNHTFTGFSSGGEKGLWCSHTSPDDTRLVVAESAIDALSHYALHRLEARYVSTGGAWSPKTGDLLRRAVERLPASGEVVLAFDQDEGGRALLAAATALLEPSNRSLRPDLPADDGRDWNDCLQARLRRHSHRPER